MKFTLAFLASLASCANAATNILVMGDWGGSGSAPWTTTEEVKTAASLKEEWSKHNVPFVMALGDNFYSMGVTSKTDSRFKDTFEDVFDTEMDDFRVLAGNHDYNGNVNAEVEYTPGPNKRWNFPSLYWTFTEKLDSGASAQFVMIDTTMLSGTSPHEHCEEGVDVCRDKIDGAELDGSNVPDAEAAADQWTWIEDQFKGSTASYLVVAGHYPVWSMAEHGPTKALTTKLMPLLQKYNATAYLCGHDHAAEHIVDPSDKSKVQYHVVGAAHLVDPSTAHVDAIPKDSLLFHSGDTKTGGMFARIEVDSKSFVVHHYANDGSKLYSSPAVGPRKFKDSMTLGEEL